MRNFLQVYEVIIHRYPKQRFGNQLFVVHFHIVFLLYLYCIFRWGCR